MAPRQPSLLLYADEMIADLFAGGGGASTGILMATGRSPSVAINHDKHALAMHEQNHPETAHLRGDVWHYDPDRVAAGRRFGLAWFSPDCTHHSKAKGGVPFRDKTRARRIRGLAWVMVRWAESQVAKPRILCMENVEEIQGWGPLVKTAAGDYQPCPDRKGQHWRRFVNRLKAAGYVVEFRELVASHYGAPTRRKRLILIARCDGLPIVWPTQTHGKHAGRTERGAYEGIDFSMPVPSIFLTPAEAKAWGKAHNRPAPKRPLVAATCRRIARGVMRYVVEDADPFLIPVTHQGDDRTHSVREPIRTITSAQRGEFALVAPTLVPTRNGERHGVHGEQAPRILDIRQPFNTVTALGSQGALAQTTLVPFLAGVGGRMGQSGERPVTKPYHTTTAKADTVLVAASLMKYHGEKRDGDTRGQSLTQPLATLDTANRFALVSAFLAKHNGGHEATGQRLKAPMDTITTKDSKALVTTTLIPADVLRPEHVEGAVRVAAFLVKFFGTGVARDLRDPAGTLTTKDRLGLVEVVLVHVGGSAYVLVDIGMRMLTPRELFRLQGFPDHYVIDRGVVDGQLVTFTAGTQTRLVGNSVPPDLAAAVVRANLEVAVA